MPDWNARRILKELVDADRRRAILADFWRFGDEETRAAAQAFLAKALHFRDASIRKLPAEKKAELLASRASLPELDQTFEAALMHYHTHEQNEMLGAFLDAWRIPHVNGSIETDDYAPPTAEQVRAAVRELHGRFDARDVAIYLATLGLLMGEPWDGAAWPVVDEVMPTSA